MLSGTKHRRKRSLQRWRVTCLCRDSNERRNRPLRVRWGFRHSCPISRRNPTSSCTTFYRCNGYRRDIYPSVPSARIEHDWCGVIWRMKSFHRRHGLLYHRT
ncbi:hypothetical protein AVEN_232377-1 [Araneus ventricosus]|uniref:Uncharacterized protein n=1 Tax=Araneus ventricosus TaxID=182803 RepID=A0A4Y2CXB0_ARAVE|nr:hypothetical protein AVEN_232377-1 [Araneus ventricosus]